MVKRPHLRRRVGVLPSASQIPNPDYPGGPADYPPQDSRPGGAPAPVPAEQQAGDPMSGWPIPHKTWRTRGGSQVTVAGCCLPMPLGCLTALGAGAVAAAWKMRARS